MGLILFNNLGQNTLEITVVIIIGIMLVLGGISTWNWFNKSMAERLDSYKASRHVAATSAFGKQINYTPDEFDIFCLTSRLNSVPSHEIPNLTEDPELQYCYDQFNAMINQSQALANESIALQLEAGDLMAQYSALKCELGNFTVYEFPLFIWDRFDEWLFWPLPDRYERFYTSSWDQIGVKFASSWSPGCLFRTGLGIPVPVSVVLSIIANGIDLEDTAQARAEESAEKMQESQDLMTEATNFLIECLGGVVPPGDPCLEQCEEDYGIPAQQLYQQAMGYCMGGELELCNQTMEQAQIMQWQYSNCTENCN